MKASDYWKTRAERAELLLEATREDLVAQGATAEGLPGLLPQTLYRLGHGLQDAAPKPGNPTDVCPLCGIHRQNAGFLKETCGDDYLKPECFVTEDDRG